MNSKQGMITIYKNRGETPLEALERSRTDEKMTYAGRLDPLAEGLLLVLIGEECKNKEKYLGLDKEYEVDVLFGFATDSYDILGKVTNASEYKDVDTDIIQSFVGKFSQKYPAFSSKTIKGKTLFSLFKKGELKDEEIPEKEVEIKKIELIGERKMSKNDLEKYIRDSISLVSGDFRQAEILEKWDEYLSSSKQENFNIVSIRVICTSGTYMRTLANSIGEKAGVSALAFGIKRKRIGEFKV
ncbi:MAG: hypothetical protein WCX27_02630 [Candidatus Paceibacterota bacterium]|jgi:tRNA pseudouridine55 synthase